MEYEEFLATKEQMNGNHGFAPVWLPEFLFPFQVALTSWAIAKGRAAILADCGLGKTLMQLVWCQNVFLKTSKPVLLLTPLAVGRQTVLEAQRFGLEAVRSVEGSIHAPITVTNYEQLHKFNPLDFSGVACDESSILKHFTGATQKQVTRFMLKIQYRSLWTATAAPNDYTELGTSSEALGGLGHTDMLTRFFKQEDAKACRKNEVNAHFKAKTGNHFAKLAYRVSQQVSGWRLKGHAQEPFWRWVCSWARACRKPSDIGFDDTGFVLPELIEQDHVVEPDAPPPGQLFTRPAFGLREEREERKRTTAQRCALAADLVKHDRPAVVWCHLNQEGDLLEKLIPNSIEVSGKHSDEYKEAAAEWFTGAKCICNSPMFSAKLATWERQRSLISKNTTERIASSVSLKPENGSGNTSSTERSTCAHTAAEIPASGNCQKLICDSVKPLENHDIERTQSFEGKSLRQHNSIDSGIRRRAPIEPCENTTLHTKRIKTPLKAKGANAESAGRKTATAGDIGCTSITATQQINIEECSAPTAILDSEHSATHSNRLNAQSCICGHLSGNRKLITKSKIFGLGQNWQHCNHIVTFATHSYEQYYQSVRRCWRFGQKKPVTVDIIASEGEQGVRDSMLRKSVAAAAMFSELVKHMNNSMAVHNEVGNERIEIPAWLK